MTNLNKLDLATTLSVTSQFAGSLAGELFLQAFKSSDTISKGAITVLPNIIGSGFLPKLSYSATLQAGAGCGFDPSGTLTYVDKEVVLKKFKLDEQICKDSFASTFQAQQLGLFSATNEVPATILDGILQIILDNMGQIIDSNIWTGVIATTASFSGLLPQFLLDSDVVDIAGTASTVSNVQSQLAEVYAAIPDTVINEPDLIIAVASNVAKNYKQSQISNNLTASAPGDKDLDYIGIPLVSIGGLTTGQMVAYRVRNIAFLTGLESDFNSVRVVDFDESDLTGNIGTQIKFSAGVGYSFGAEIVYYLPI